jgi:hypothetical protein
MAILKGFNINNFLEKMKVGEVGGGEEGWADEAMVCCLYPNQTILQERHNRTQNPSKADLLLFLVSIY